MMAGSKLAHLLRQTLARMAVLKYGLADDRRREQWKQELTQYRTALNQHLADFPHLKVQAESMMDDEWRNARTIAARMLAE